MWSTTSALLEGSFPDVVDHVGRGFFPGVLPPSRGPAVNRSSRAKP